MGFKKNIKKYRKLNKMTQKELGDKIGKKPLTISRYENGEIFPPFEVIEKIANIFNFPTEIFLTNDPENFNEEIFKQKNVWQHMAETRKKSDENNDKKEENSDNKIDIKVNHEKIIDMMNFIRLNEKEKKYIENLKHELLHYLNFKDEFLNTETTKEEKSKRIEKILSFIEFLYFQDIIKK
ncbi:helix-turn-helix transcriptional regulator [uncultured Fusobacterium sp.]|uniref:helix-turn-helix domain-containing protein n=1 Tax=uncultured Fusobacterium sp. TaxID=159267 RepID=UPI0028059474|nr:helix-turn-helix transcriptional regulator [uncultured Fusobacterium sp.]